MVKVYINNTKHIANVNIYIPPRDSTSKDHTIVDTDIQHCKHHIPHSVLTGDVNAHSNLWHSYTDEPRRQLIVDVISNSDDITLKIDTPIRVLNTTLQQTSSPVITSVSKKTIQSDIVDNSTRTLIRPPPIITTINIRHGYRLQQTDELLPSTRKSGYTEVVFAQTTGMGITNIHTANTIFTNIILMADNHNIPKCKKNQTNKQQEESKHM